MLKRNIVVNFFGSGYAVLLQFAMLPLTLRHLGAEAFGLIGVFVTLQALASILDGGLAPAVARELARLSVTENGDGLMRATVRTLELLCAGIAVLVVLSIWIAAPAIATYWLNASKMPTDSVVFCLRAMGVQTAFYLLATYYAGGINGLQLMPLCNGLTAILQTVRALGVVVVLVSLGKGAEWFFAWQAIATGLTALAMAVALDRALPAIGVSSFSRERLAACSKFATGMAGITLATLGLTQIDKLLLSKLLSLEDFGYYTTASMIAGAISRPASLVFAAILPRMTQLHEANDFVRLQSVYMKSCRLIAWLTIPPALVLAVFHAPILTMYFSSAALASHVGPIAAVISIGMAFNGLMHTPYSLTLAYGWPEFAIRQNVIATIFLVPAIFIGTSHYGALGAAWAWVGLNAAYVMFSMYFIHGRCLPGTLLHWYTTNGLIAAFCACVALVAFRFV